MRLRYSANSMKVHVVSPPEFTKLDCKNSTTIITRVQRELVSWAVVGQIGYQGSLGGPPIMTSGRLSLPSTPRSPNEVDPRGVPGDGGDPPPRQPLQRPAHHVQHLNTTHGPPSGQVRPSGVDRGHPGRGPSMTKSGAHPPTHPRRPRRARESLPDTRPDCQSTGVCPIADGIVAVLPIPGTFLGEKQPRKWSGRPGSRGERTGTLLSTLHCTLHCTLPKSRTNSQQASPSRE